MANPSGIKERTSELNPLKCRTNEAIAFLRNSKFKIQKV